MPSFVNEFVTSKIFYTRFKQLSFMYTRELDAIKQIMGSRSKPKDSVYTCIYNGQKKKDSDPQNTTQKNTNLT